MDKIHPQTCNVDALYPVRNHTCITMHDDVAVAQLELSALSATMLGNIPKPNTCRHHCSNNAFQLKYDGCK